MSGLAGVLAQHTPAGVYRWHGAFDVAAVRHTVEHAGWRFGYVDGWRFQTKAEFLTAIGEAFAFPAHYGHNFDALADCLRDVQGSGGHGVVLLWDGWSTLAAEDDAAFRAARDVFARRAAADDFLVLLRGEGPDLDGTASLD